MTGTTLPRSPRATPRPVKPHAAPPGTTQPPASISERTRLIEDVLEEIGTHTPADAIRHMRRWPSGSLSLVHLHVLTVLEADGSVPMRSLAESLDVSQASATGIVDRMEQRGLVERRRDDEDRRVIRVALADDGRELLAGVAAERRDRLGLLLNELTDDELDGFLRGSRALRAARTRLVPKWALAAQTTKPSQPTPLDEAPR
jgi:DNA-binding MarR family transcriptional regulator